MRKKQIKLLALVLLSIFLLSNVVQGKSPITKVTATIDESINITWNGEGFRPKEDNGTIVHPITYNGRTYLPVRFIVEKAGVNVGWNEKTKTVILNHSSINIDNKGQEEIKSRNLELEKQIKDLQQENKNLKLEIRELNYEIEDLEYDNKKLQGKGKESENKIYWTNGDLQYEGGLINGIRNGYGKEYNRTGIVAYEGNWINDAKNGYGIEYDRNGKTIYEGNWKDDKRHGLGTSYDEKGNISVEGNWKDDKMHGFSITYLRGELFYVGEYVNGNREGLGAYFENGKFKYEGIWRNNTIIEITSRNLYSTQTPSLRSIISGQGEIELEQNTPLNNNGGWYIDGNGNQIYKDYNY